jgi:hypothetical protein
MGWQLPPLNKQPFWLIKEHSVPSFTLVQTMVITSFLSNKNSNPNISPKWDYLSREMMKNDEKKI